MSNPDPLLQAEKLVYARAKLKESPDSQTTILRSLDQDSIRNMVIEGLKDRLRLNPKILEQTKNVMRSSSPNTHSSNSSSESDGTPILNAPPATPHVHSSKEPRSPSDDRSPEILKFSKSFRRG